MLRTVFVSIKIDSLLLAIVITAQVCLLYYQSYLHFDMTFFMTFFQLFWIAFAELSFGRILDLLKALWKPLSLPDEIFYLPNSNLSANLYNQKIETEIGENLDSSGGDFHGFCFTNFDERLDQLPAPFRIMQPTAMALLSPDYADISLFPQKNALSIPRYSSLNIMMIKLKELIDSVTL